MSKAALAPILYPLTEMSASIMADMRARAASAKAPSAGLRRVMPVRG
jgi:hypothetical protein